MCVLERENKGEGWIERQEAKDRHEQKKAKEDRKTSTEKTPLTHRVINIQRAKSEAKLETDIQTDRHGKRSQKERQSLQLTATNLKRTLSLFVFI